MPRLTSATTAVLALGLSVSIGLLSAPALAGVPTEQLRASIDQVVKVLDDPALKADANAAKRREAIRQVANNIFDFQEAAKRSLGRHWEGLSEKDRSEFTALFSDLLERSYIAKIEQYRGERISYAGDSADADTATVKTRFTTKNGTDIPIDYRMLHKGDRWLVYDVSVEGLSLISNYRGQFNKIIETSSYQDLVKRMKARSDEFQAPAAAGKRDS
jgi:phospholipid transport system substrate-binding protein